MNRDWRLILSGSARGAWNMAVDRAILEAVADEESPPTFRLYAWDPPCLSLGHAQPAGVIDESGLAAEGWDLVRRPTGGRALLHADELTYAIIAPILHPALSGGVVDSYRHLSQGLVAGLRALGIDPDPLSNATLSAEERANPVCFEVPSAYEVTVRRRKLVGSAQLRRRQTALQHGSLPLRGDITRVIRGLRFERPVDRRQAAERLARHATTLEAELGRPVSWDEAARAMVDGFASALGLPFTPGDLTPSELHRAEIFQSEAPPMIDRPARSEREETS